METSSGGLSDSSAEMKLPPSLVKARVARGWRSRPPEPDYERLLLEQLPFIERTIGALVRRYAVNRLDAGDFEGQVKLQLVADDYAVLRKFQGKSRLTTFLTAVIHNQFRDFRAKQWGKWRPSAAAKRLGDLGVQLEALLFRDGFTRSEAVSMLADRAPEDVPAAELERVAESLQPRTTRRFESDAVLDRLRSPERGDRDLRDGERAAVQARVERALRRVLGRLEPIERLILRMRFADGTTIRAIAATLGIADGRMYSRLRRLLAEVRRGVEHEGVACGEVLDLLDWPEARLQELLATDDRAPATSTDDG